jgi:hypothetical protein
LVSSNYLTCESWFPLSSMHKFHLSYWISLLLLRKKLNDVGKHYSFLNQIREFLHCFFLIYGFFVVLL